MQQQNPDFLRQCVHEIGSALFYNQNSGLPGYQTTIINSLSVDEAFNLYAIVEKKVAGFYHGDRPFPAELLFYRKGKPFYLKMWGTAALVEDGNVWGNITGLENASTNLMDSSVGLLRISVENIYYHEYKQPMYFGWKGKLSRMRDWFTGIRAFSFSLQLTAPQLHGHGYYGPLMA